MSVNESNEDCKWITSSNRVRVVSKHVFDYSGGLPHIYHSFTKENIIFRQKLLSSIIQQQH